MPHEKANSGPQAGTKLSRPNDSPKPNDSQKDDGVSQEAARKTGNPPTHTATPSLSTRPTKRPVTPTARTRRALSGPIRKTPIGSQTPISLASKSQVAASRLGIA
jgi:hypothetical protein